MNKKLLSLIILGCIVSFNVRADGFASGPLVFAPSVQDCCLTNISQERVEAILNNIWAGIANLDYDGGMDVGCAYLIKNRDYFSASNYNKCDYWIKNRKHRDQQEKDYQNHIEKLMKADTVRSLISRKDPDAK